MLPQVDHIVWVFDDATANREIELVCCPILEGVVAKSMHDFRLVWLCPWRTSGYLVWIDLHLVGSDNSGNNESWEILS